MRIIWKIVLLFLGMLISALIVRVVFGILATAVASEPGLSPEEKHRQASLFLEGVGAQVAMNTINQMLMIVTVYVLVRLVDRRCFTWSCVGLHRIENKLKLLGVGGALAVAMLTGTLGIGLGLGTLRYATIGTQLFSPGKIVEAAILVAVMCVAVGFGEEIAFRGYLQGRISEKSGAFPSVFIASFVFALMHPWPTSPAPLLLLFDVQVVGMVFGLLFYYTGSLWAPIGLHILWNYLQIVLVMARNAADDRFYFAPIVVLDTLQPVRHLLIEIGVGLAVAFILLLLIRARMRSGAKEPELVA